MTNEQLAQYIDHTVLSPTTTSEDIARLCVEAEAHGFKSVCVPPFYVSKAKELLEDSNVLVATVIGFPFGFSDVNAKIAEIRKAIDDDVDELDVVVNITAIKEGDWDYVQNEIDSLSTATAMKDKIFKLIFETGVLEKEEIIKLCEIVADTQVDFAKTSTGYNGPGAKSSIVKLMRKHLPQHIKIKASGGIRSRKDALKMIEAGAERLGASASIKILEGKK